MIPVVNVCTANNNSSSSTGSSSITYTRTETTTTGTDGYIHLQLTVISLVYSNITIFT